MGLTVSRKTAKNLAVKRNNERILSVSRKKMLTVKKSNHKIRSRGLLLSLMFYAFLCSGSENYNRNRNRVFNGLVAQVVHRVFFFKESWGDGVK